MSIIMVAGLHACLRCTVSILCSPILEDLDISEAARALWEAPFAILSHNRFEDDEPKFTYANQVSLPVVTLVLPYCNAHFTARQG